MEINQLRQFKVIAETENITKAAEILYVSQPALSQMLNNLEEEFGVKFFDRIKKKIYLNDNGKKFLEQTNIILNDIAALDTLFDQTDSAKYMIGSPASSVIWYYLPVLYKLIPQITIDSMLIKQGNITEALLNETIDFALQFEQLKNPQIYNIPINDISFYIAADEKHPLSKYDEIKMSDLNGYEFMSVKAKDNYIGKYIYKIIKENGICFKNMVILDDASAHLKSFNFATNYVTIVNSLSLAAGDYNDKKIIKIRDAQRLTLYFSYKKTRKKNIDNIIDIFVGQYGSIASGKFLNY